MQYVVQTTSEKAAITTRLAVEAYKEELSVRNILDVGTQFTKPAL